MADNSEITPENNAKAYQSVIDFNKVIISIASTIIAVLVSYLVLQDNEFNWLNYLSPFFLVISIIFALMGFGYSLPAIQKNEPSEWALVSSNIGAGVMIIGIFLISTINIKKQDQLDKVVSNIENSFTENLPMVNMKNCKNFKLKSNIYYFIFEKDSLIVEVKYSKVENRITSFKKIKTGKH